MAQKQEPLHTALIRTISESEIPDEVGAAIEVVLDSKTSASLLRDLPIVGLLLAGKDLAGRWSDELLARKIARFLAAIGSAPWERAEMIRRLDTEPEYEGRVGERLLSVLQRIDDTEKATLMGRAFKAYLRRNINGATLARLVVAIDSLLLSDLRALPRYHEKGLTSNLTLQAYLASGLAHIPHGMATAHYVETLELTIPLLEYVLQVESV